MSTTMNPAQGMQELVAVSRFYGANEEFVIAGGGNTSFKTDDVLYVKASGTALAVIDADGFVELDRAQLQALLERKLSDDPHTREEQFKEAILAARLRPELGQRPSVESVIHHLLPARLVVHTHATWVNMITCSKDGESIVREKFGDDVLWIPYVDPGYTLAQSVNAALVDYQERTGRSDCPIVLLDNHGLIVGGETQDEVSEKTNRIVGLAKEVAGNVFDPSAAEADAIPPALAQITPILRGLLAEGPGLKTVVHSARPEVMNFVDAAASKAITEAGPMSPDQIVYCNSYPLWVGAADDVAAISGKLAAYRSQYNADPKVILVPGVGLLGVADSYKDAQTTVAVYTDAIRVMAGAQKLGGADALTDRERSFIEDWEVEAYRKKIAAANRRRGRVAGKVALVTGAAQGFGLEIAQGLAAEGACVVLADLNIAKAREEAAALASEHGKGSAMAVSINVTDEASVREAFVRIVKHYGGIDLVVANAGVLRAASVKDLSERDFDFVNSVNYKGYFLTVKAAAPIMALQHAAKPDWRGDIVQINSKSGLVGSNKNGAYAGSKFGGIGLTQSFALELVEDGIKVNSVCPGNFFDGPLWSDPKNGLFVQYLETGKVPGAKTVEDVKRFYESKVPMKRGCTTPDVLKAILYLVDQDYETGQALPVTGGQVMLH